MSRFGARLFRDACCALGGAGALGWNYHYEIMHPDEAVKTLKQNLISERQFFRLQFTNMTKEVAKQKVAQRERAKKEIGQPKHASHSEETCSEMPVSQHNLLRFAVDSCRQSPYFKNFPSRRRSKQLRNA